MRRVRRLLLITPLACSPPLIGDADSSGEPASTGDASTDTGAMTGDATGDATGSASVTDSTGESPTGEPFDDTHDTDVSPVAGACQPGAGPSDAFVDCVESFTPEGAMYGQDRFPQVVYGPPMPGAGGTGSTDVLALGCGGEITLYFDAPAIVDGPGPDFIVFENPLPVGMSTFVEPARVLVSADGVDWRAFPCEPAADDPPIGCAGVARVLAGDPTDPASAGGDSFDLADVGLTDARYLRLLDVGVAYYGARTWCGGGGGGFDLDAVAVVHGDI